jgi:hypothetical protein
MNKNTMFYGLLIAGGLLVYYAWKSKKANDDKAVSNTTSNSGTFVDDVSVLEETGGLKDNKLTLVDDLKGSVSAIVEPFIMEEKKIDLSGQSI